MTPSAFETLGVSLKGVSYVSNNSIEPPGSADNSASAVSNSTVCATTERPGSDPDVAVNSAPAAWGAPVGDSAADGASDARVQSQAVAPLIVHADGNQYLIAPESLVDVPIALYQQQWANVRELVFVLQNLLDWPNDLRSRALCFIVGIGRAYTIRVYDSDEETDDIFDASLRLMVGPGDVDRCERGRRAALEAGVLSHPNAIEPVCNRIQTRLQELGVRGYKLSDLIEDARRISMLTRPAEQAAGMDIAVLFPDAGAPLGLLVPAGWYLAYDGIRRAANNQGPLLLTCPLLIQRRLIHADNETESVEIAWNKDGVWQSRVVARELLATARSITELAAFGIPVTSNSSADLVQYLADFEARNLANLPREAISRILGWQGTDGQNSFLCGTELLVGGSTPTAIRIGFAGADPGDAQLAAGFHAKGTFDAWREAVRPLAQFPRARLSVYASLAPPLLRILETPNFVFHNGGATSAGKTINLRVAASVWGCPDERTPGAVLNTWDATRTWIERAAGVRQDLPLVLDDTMHARDTEMVAQTIYEIATGRGRGRGTISGTQQTASYRTIVLSTGESPIVAATQDGGSRGRTLEIWGSPFGRTDPATAVLVNGLNDAVLENYGHAGPYFVRYLLENREQWPRWRQLHRDWQRWLLEQLGGNPVANRLATPLATLIVTEGLATQSGTSPWALGATYTVQELWGDLVREINDADLAEAALAFVCGWAVAHRHAFWPPVNNQAGPGHQGWAGRWDRIEGWEWIGFFQENVKELLRENNYDSESIIRQWRDRGWLRLSPDRAYYRARVGEPSADLVAILREHADRYVGPDTREAGRSVGPLAGGGDSDSS